MLTRKIHSANDGLLLAQLAEGGKDAFDRLYELYWEQVVNEAYKRTGNRDHAKDIAQEVFTSLWLRGTEKPIENLPAWLYTVTRNNVYRLMNRMDRFVPVHDLLTELQAATDLPDSAVMAKDLKQAYETVINSLPDQQRIIYRMRYSDDLSPDQIATQLNLSPKTVRNHIGRALLRLKATILFLQILFIVTGR